SVESESIDYVIHAANYYQGPPGWTATGYIMRELGLGEVPSLQVNQECNGLMAALEVAIGQLTGIAGRKAALLTSASSWSTPLVDRWRSLGPQAVLSDAGAAMTVTSHGGFAEVLSLNGATLPGEEGWLRGAGSLLPPDRDANWFFDPVQRAVEYASASGRSMQEWLDAAGEQCRQLCLRSLDEAKLDAAELAKVIGFHLARYALAGSVADPLGLPLERTNWACGRSTGHAGPCDHLISIDRLMRTGELGPGDHALLVSWGGGWNTTAAVVKILHVPDWARGA
ncbi:MAG: hypothetical protein JO285_08180, partial [Kutzneria sp.]|nr:hypothetical protein [Kutzneria sp.]